MKGQRGSALAEFAITVPLIALILAGISEYGRFTYDGSEVGNAARAGVQYGAQTLFTAADTGAGGGIELAAKADAGQVSGLTVTSSNACSCYNSPASGFACTTSVATQPCTANTSDHRVIQVSVTAGATFVPFMHFPGIPNSLVITRTAIQQVAP